MKQTIKKTLFFATLLLLSFGLSKGMENNEKDHPFGPDQLCHTVAFHNINEQIIQFLRNQDNTIQKLTTARNEAKKILATVIKNLQLSSDTYSDINNIAMKYFILHKGIKGEEELTQELSQKEEEKDKGLILYLHILTYIKQKKDEIKRLKEQMQQKEERKKEIGDELERRRINPENCPICMDSMNHNATGENKKVRIWCGHPFHKKCIDQWAENNNTCPICRREPRNCEALKKFLEDFNLEAYQRPQAQNQNPPILNFGRNRNSTQSGTRFLWMLDGTYLRDEDAEELLRSNRNRNQMQRVPYNPGWVAR